MSQSVHFISLAVLVLLPFLSTSGIFDKLKDKLESTPVSVDTDLLDLNLDDFINAKINVDIGVRRNRDKQTFSRTEEVKFSPRIYKDQSSDKVAFSSFIDGTSSIQFVRQFPTQMAAANVVKFPPYGPKKIPTTAKIALEELKAGDYVRFLTHMTLGVGPSAAEAMGVTQISGAIRYILSGDFQLEFYKIKNDKFLLRASTLKRKTFSASLAYQPTTALRIFAEVADNSLKDKLHTQLNKFLIPTTFASSSRSTASGNLLTIEYLYRFSSSQDPGALAFEDIVNPERWMTDQYHVLKQTLTTDGVLADAIVIRLAESERLAKLAGHQTYDVKRNSRSSAEFVEKRSSIQMNLRLVNGNKSNSYVEQNFTVQNAEGFWKHYKLANLLKAGQLGFAKLVGRTEKREANVILDMTADGQIGDFLNMHFEYSRNEQHQTNNELRIIQQRIHRFMPSRFHEQLNLRKFADGFIRRDTRVDVELMFHEKAFDLTRHLTAKDVNMFVDDYFDEINDDHRLGSPVYGKVSIHHGQYNENLSWKQNAEDSVEKIKRSLLIAFGSNVQIQPKSDWSWRKLKFWNPIEKPETREVLPEDKWVAIRELRRDRVFFQLGPGIFARLLDLAIEKCKRTPECDLLDQTEDLDNAWENFAAFRVTATAKDKGAVGITFGDYDRFQGIRNILRSRDRILGRNFDPEYFKFDD